MTKRSALVFIAIVGFVVYGLTLRGSVGNFDDLVHIQPMLQNPAFESPHERSTYSQMHALLTTGSPALTRTMANFGNDDVGFYKGKLYSFFPPGVAISSIPLYLLGSLIGLGQIFAYSTVAIIATATLLLLFLCMTEIFNASVYVGIITALVFGFGTTSWSYAITIYQHLFTTFFLVASLYIFYKFKKEKLWSWAFLGSLIYIVSPFFDYVNLLILAPFVIYFFITVVEQQNKNSSLEKNQSLYSNHKILIPVFVMLIAFVLPLVYNQAVFGNWQIATNALPKFTPGMSDYELNNPARLQILDRTVSRFSLNNCVWDVYVLFFSLNNGLFIFSPILLLGIGGVFQRKNYIHTENFYLLASLCCITFIYSLFDDPHGGSSFGPRYLIPLMAGISLFGGQWFAHYKHTLHAKIIVFVLFCISSATALLGALTTNLIPFYAYLPDYRFYSGANVALGELMANRSGDFIYTTFFSHTFSLEMYFIAIYIVTLGGMGYMLTRRTL